MDEVKLFLVALDRFAAVVGMSRREALQTLAYGDDLTRQKYEAARSLRRGGRGRCRSVPRLVRPR